jgi:hypothetical protein
MRICVLSNAHLPRAADIEVLADATRALLLADEHELLIVVNKRKRWND